jgi:hypothetical protein
MPKGKSVEIEIEVSTDGHVMPFKCPKCGHQFPALESSGNNPQLEISCSKCKTKIKGTPVSTVARRLNGRICWTEFGPPCAVMQAIVRSDRIAFDTTDGTWEYTVSLQPSATPSIWEGRWRCLNPPCDGHVDARKYDCPDGGVVLVGTWRDAEGDWWWFMELRP